MIWVVVIAGLVASVDQLTKWLVTRFIEFDEAHVIIPGFFSIVHWRNTGAAWGMLRDYNLVLAGVSLITILVLYLLRHTFQLHRAVSRLALGLIAGGIVGNLLDRVRVGSVIDFLDFQVAGRHWPAFNVADSAICVGVVLYMIISWHADKGTDKPSPFEKERSHPVIHF